MFKKLAFLVVVMALASAAQALVFYDDFDKAWVAPVNIWDPPSCFIDYDKWAESGGTAYKIGDWDGFIGEVETDVAYNYVSSQGTGNAVPGEDPDAHDLNGVLRITGIGNWEGPGNTGAFLYKNVTGDFVAEVQVVDCDFWWHHLGGLMARQDPDGGLENHIELSYFPVWGVGNLGHQTQDSAEIWEGADPWIGYPPQPYLQLERAGDVFYLRVSPDGSTWTQIAEQTFDLSDELQVGIFHATFHTIQSTMDFDNFSIIPEPATVALLGLGGLALIRRKRG